MGSCIGVAEDSIRFFYAVSTGNSLPVNTEYHHRIMHLHGGQGVTETLLHESYKSMRERGRSVGISTDYGLDGSGSNPGEDEIFRLFTPALGTTQPPVQWVPGLSRE